MPGPSRRLESVLFLDVVGSTNVAATVGDQRWREVLTRFNRIVRADLKRFGGHEEDTAGDGFFATFPVPAQAVRCAHAIVEDVRELGLEIRAGVHTGETEAIDGKRGGLGVVIGARVMSLGGAGEVLVTSTTKELVTGSGLEFEPMSAHELKGVPGTWQVFALRAVDGQAVGRQLPAEEAVDRLDRIHPAPFIQRRLRPVAAVVALILVVAIAAVAIHRAVAPSPVTVMKVDPQTNRIEAVLRDGVQSLHRPAAIWYDGSSLWQSTNQEHATPTGELLRRDPTTGAIQSTHTLDTGEGLGFAFGYAWIAHDLGPDRASLDKVDPASGKVLATVQLPGELADVNADARSLWYLSHQGDLVEIDPLSAKIVHTYSVAGSAVAPSKVVPLLGSVWICDCDHGQILKVDPATGEVTKTVTLQERGFLIGVDSSDGKTLWLLDPAAGTITPLDPNTGDPGQPLGFGGGNVYDAQIGFGSIWVAAGSQLFRFDLATGERHPIAIPAGASAGGLALDETDGVVWVENCGCPDR
jgi:class 3 adenylate cyclase/streptogramin lyase